MSIQKIRKLTENVFKESINDKNLFKAIFMCGGPGAGKSFISKQIYRNNLKIVNSDILFEFLLTKNKMSKIIAEFGTDEYGEQMKLRDQGKKLTGKLKENYLNGMLPVILDGTGKNFKKTKEAKDKLEDIGYDCSMIFVNTDLETALTRNKNRERSVNDDIVKNSWTQVQTNIGKFQQEFGDHFYIVDNSEGHTLDKKRLNQIENKTLNDPLQNREGLRIIDELSKSGGKYMSDLLPSESL